MFRFAAERVSVVAAEDHPLYRSALAGAIEADPGLELVKIASDGREALAAVFEHEPDVALLDMRMPHLEGTAVARRVRDAQLATRVVILSAFHNEQLVAGALEAGCCGYLSKLASASEICDAVARAADGETVVDGVLADEIAALRACCSELSALSPRELSVLHLMAGGLKTEQIAVELKVAVGTVRTHIAQLYRKLDVNDRSAAVAEAMRRGMLA